jgi:hypothetical protein
MEATCRALTRDESLRLDLYLQSRSQPMLAVRHMLSYARNCQGVNMPPLMDYVEMFKDACSNPNVVLHSSSDPQRQYRCLKKSSACAKDQLWIYIAPIQIHDKN